MITTWVKDKLIGWAKDKLMRLLDLAFSQRTFVAVITMVVARFGLHISDTLTAEMGAAISAFLLVTIMHRPPGAPTAAQVTAAKPPAVSPSLAPPRMFPDPITRQPQAVDEEDPRR